MITPHSGLTSDAPLELPSFRLTPSQQQVVFQGDSLPFQCQASLVAEDMQVLWYQNGRMVKPDAAQGIFIEKRIVQNCSLIARYDFIWRIPVRLFEQVQGYWTWIFYHCFSEFSPLVPLQCLDHLKHSAWIHWELGVPNQDQQGQHNQDGPHCGAGDLFQVLCSRTYYQQQGRVQVSVHTLWFSSWFNPLLNSNESTLVVFTICGYVVCRRGLGPFLYWTQKQIRKSNVFQHLSSQIPGRRKKNFEEEVMSI